MFHIYQTVIKLNAEHSSFHTYGYTYMYVCVCVCVVFMGCGDLETVMRTVLSLRRGPVGHKKVQEGILKEREENRSGRATEVTQRCLDINTIKPGSETHEGTFSVTA